MIDRDAGNALNLVFMCVALDFYFVIRNGMNRHIVSDPALTSPQTAVGRAGHRECLFRHRPGTRRVQLFTRRPVISK